MVQWIKALAIQAWLKLHNWKDGWGESSVGKRTCCMGVGEEGCQHQCVSRKQMNKVGSCRNITNEWTGSQREFSTGMDECDKLTCHFVQLQYTNKGETQGSTRISFSHFSKINIFIAGRGNTEDRCVSHGSSQATRERATDEVIPSPRALCLLLSVPVKHRGLLTATQQAAHLYQALSTRAALLSTAQHSSHLCISAGPFAR